MRPFALHRQQPEKDKQKVDFAPPGKISADAHVKSEVFGLQVQFACQFGLIDVTLHMRSPLGSPL